LRVKKQIQKNEIVIDNQKSSNSSYFSLTGNPFVDGGVYEYSKFFKRITGFEPYPFQKKLFKEFWLGNDILLKAPTGSGKTWASILPFIFAYNQKAHTPKKLIYSLPLRTLANSLYHTVSNNSIIKNTGIKVSLQTGEFPNDKFFESDIIFTTIDQTLSAILGFPYSLSKRQANINAGAIIGSYLIFDEFHLLDPSRSLATSLNVLKVLKELSHFCIMTATISDRSIKGINEFLKSVSITLDSNEFDLINILKNKKDIAVKHKELQSEDILKEHKKKTIVICNTVEKAQRIYLDLKQKTDIEVICIHSRFFKKDRIEKEGKIIDTFGKNSGNIKEAILISTQVIEVGLDISCDTLHTEISPINSFLQRAGRCARFENEKGKIFVYDVGEDKRQAKLYFPYEKELCIDTMRELEKVKSLDYTTSERIVNSVFAEKERREIDNAKNFDSSRIKKSWEESDKGVGRELIRNIDSINIVLLKKSDGIHSMFDYDSISVNPHTLENKLKVIAEQYDNKECPLVSVIEESNIIDDFDITKLTISEIPIEDIKLYPRIILNPEYVNYNDEIGLNFFLKEKSGPESMLQKGEKRAELGYKKETYKEHITNMIKIYENEFKNEIYYPISVLWDKYNFTTDIDEMIKFMLIMHDYGKLNNEWQKVAREIQKLKGNYKEGEFLAHTDFDPTKEKLPGGLPSHSGIGAMVSFAILEDIIQNQFEFETVTKAITSAIIRHHSTTSHKVKPYRIEDKGFNMILELIKEYTPSFYKFNTNNEVIKKWKNAEDLTSFTVNFDNPDNVFLYFILVRILRLCDQKSMEDKDVSK